MRPKFILLFQILKSPPPHPLGASPDRCILSPPPGLVGTLWLSLLNCCDNSLAILFRSIFTIFFFLSSLPLTFLSLQGYSFFFIHEFPSPLPPICYVMSPSFTQIQLPLLPHLFICSSGLVTIHPVSEFSLYDNYSETCTSIFLTAPREWLAATVVANHRDCVDYWHFTSVSTLSNSPYRRTQGYWDNEQLLTTHVSVTSLKWGLDARSRSWQALAQTIAPLGSYCAGSNNTTREIPNSFALTCASL